MYFCGRGQLLKKITENLTEKPQILDAHVFFLMYIYIWRLNSMLHSQQCWYVCSLHACVLFWLLYILKFNTVLCSTNVMYCTSTDISLAILLYIVCFMSIGQVKPTPPPNVCRCLQTKNKKLYDCFKNLDVYVKKFIIVVIKSAVEWVTEPLQQTYLFSQSCSFLLFYSFTGIEKMQGENKICRVNKQSEHHFSER